MSLQISNCPVGSMQITHQAALVAPLWQEAQSLEGQCPRLEETLREEINT
jgi:hypothetical protein